MGDSINYKFDVIWGSVRMGRPTGEWIQRDDGYWYEVYTDTIHYDGSGNEIRREPTICWVGMSTPPPWLYPEAWEKRSRLKNFLRRVKTLFFFFQKSENSLWPAPTAGPNLHQEPRDNEF